MKIVFINPSIRPDATYRFLPVGLAYILSAVKKAGYEFDLIDMDIEEMSASSLRERLAQNTYDVYALGCIVSGFKYAVEIFEVIKETNPDAMIVAGNSLASSIPKLLLERTKADIAILGEGDITIVELLKAIGNKEDLSTVLGIAYRENNRIIYTKSRTAENDINAFGFPDWDIFDLSEYNKYTISQDEETGETSLAYPLNSARGCPYSCTFCYHAFKGQNYRKYSIESVKREIERLHYEYGAKKIMFWDELTFTNLKQVRELVDMIMSLDFKIEWKGSSRCDLFTMDDVGLIREMKDSGCTICGGALENGSEEIRKAINKKINIEQFKENNKALLAGGVPPVTSVIFGYPQETHESIQLTLDLCEESNIYPSAGFLLALPGTSIYQWAIQNGFITNEYDYLMEIGDRQDLHLNLTKMSDKELVSAVEDGLGRLAKKLGLELENVMKTKKYQIPSEDKH
jgi:radical SAM superfamily enzyme YgiQ (UPF0313 family)